MKLSFKLFATGLNGFHNSDLAALNYVRKYLCAVTTLLIATVDGYRISHRAFEGMEGNSLRKASLWPCVHIILHRTFLAIWKNKLDLKRYCCIPLVHQYSLQNGVYV